MLPARVKLLPPRPLVITGRGQRPVRWKRVALDPVEYEERDDSVQHVHDRPRMEVLHSRRQPKQQAHRAHDAHVNTPRSGRVQPLDADVRRL